MLRVPIKTKNKKLQRWNMNSNSVECDLGVIKGKLGEHSEENSNMTLQIEK